jgi:photosystem II stability/assembly factor-like uncharacterized protein
VRSVLGLCLFGATALVACTTPEGEGLDAGSMEDGGPVRVWEVEPGIPTQEDLMAIWGRSWRDPETRILTLDVFAVGFGGTVIHFDGTTWTRETTTSTQPLTGISGTGLSNPMDPRAPPSRVFAVGWRGTILERQSDGTWSPATSTATETDDLFDVDVGSNMSGMAVGDSGRVIGWNGTRWDTARFRIPSELAGLYIEPKSVLRGVWAESAERYYIVGGGGAAFRSSGGAMAFQALDTTISEPLVGVWGPNGSEIFAVGLDSLLLQFDGNQWRRRSLEGLPRVFLMEAYGLGGDITIVGWRGTILRRGPDGYIQERTDVTSDLRAVWIDPETEIAWAVGASGTVLRRTPPPPPDAGI